MRMPRLLAILAVLCALTMGLPIVGTIAFSHLFQNPDDLPQAKAIVVLSGGGARDDLPVGHTRGRVLKAVELWHAGYAPLLVMSGAGPTIEESQVPDSRGMRRLAEQEGVPTDAIIEEDRSYSTLLNAWNTAAMAEIDRTKPVILVTNRFHMPRAWASFRWAGFTNLTLVSYETEPPKLDSNIYVEGLKWPYNIARAIGAWLAFLAGIQEAKVLAWLE